MSEQEESSSAAKPAWEVDPVAPERAEAGEDPLARALAGDPGKALRGAWSLGEELVLEIAAEGIEQVCRALRERHGYRLLVDLCGVHFPKREEAPLEVVYHLYNLEERRRVRLRVAVGEEQEVPTVSGIYRGANWLEREAWDMFGIRFGGHPDLTRILMWEGFNGHPLRKEFPIEGIDTGAAIYPEYYGEEAGPVAGTGTGWKPPQPPAEGPVDEEKGEEGREAGPGAAGE